MIPPAAILLSLAMSPVGISEPAPTPPNPQPPTPPEVQPDPQPPVCPPGPGVDPCPGCGLG